ncbi:MAG: CPBP family intramembrane glutamic endopeptidase [Candidatus Micrarchaeaceae archaeon]
MENSVETNRDNRGKTTLAIIMVVALILPIPFFTAIQLFHLNGLPVYFLQLALYLMLYLLAFWGLKKERIPLAINTQKLLEAIGYLLASWLLYVLFLHISGIAKLPEEIQTLLNIPAWKIGAQILSTWFFVGIAEELLFRGYFLASFKRYLTQGENRRRTITTVLITSLFFSLWHLPSRINSIISGEINFLLLLLSLFVLFFLGIGYAYLFIRTQNILLVGLVHGVNNFPLIGQETQLSFLILLAAIVYAEIARSIMKKKENISQVQ